jgi:ADP-heptose:LPS heptosyltransferase
MHIVLSRTDSIGDVVLTLPMAGLIRERYPRATITFIGRRYTEPVIRLSKYIDRFIRWDDYEKLSVKKQARVLKELECDWLIHVFPNKQIAKAARKAQIKNRVGTSHRTFHWPTCNRLISFSRRRSELHEAQLNCKLLAPLGVGVPELEEIKNYYGFSIDASLKAKVATWLDRTVRI